MPLKSSENQTNGTTGNQKITTVKGAQPQQSLDKEMSLQNEQAQELNRPVVRKTSMNAAATPFEPTATCSNNTPPTIGQDLWRQLKRVQIPVFTGEKKNYQSWKASFLACIDSAPATAEYKLLQLRQYVSGEALKVIDSLGHSAAAYEAAKGRLDRKYGGKRRQIALYLEELEEFPQIRQGHAKDIEEFADLLDIAMINLQEAGQHHELGFGSLYAKLQRKIPEAMLARYHRWVFECNKEESVLSLREWILQESEFQTIATEAVRGCQERLQNHHIAQHLDRGTSEHFSVKQIMFVFRKCHASIVERIMAYGTVQNSIEEKWQMDGISLNTISYAFGV